ncbi:peptidoglycan-binding protein [Brachybacterium vulturis]|uniref:C40 family peptidase n=1 Tax=Brachybacterium vulturis TaxID=2017484 RepID=UPI0037354668
MIDYRGFTAPVGRGVGGAAMVGAVSAAAVLTGGAAATAQAPVASTVGTVRGIAPSVAPATQSQFTSVTLRLGARGAAVSHLQQQLNAHGASLTVDGVFGSATLRAVRSQQSGAGIGVDGVVGPKTWGSLTGAVATAPSTGTSQPTLRFGSRGSAVTTLQKQLNASGASISVDGVFGRGTAGAVRALQSAAGIGVDGVVGPKTRAALSGGVAVGGGTSAPSAPSAPATQPKLRHGDRGAAVTSLQKSLNASGASISVDGVFGRGTAGAVRALQSAAGIGVDGIVGPRTWNALGSDVRISADTGGRDEDRTPVSGVSVRGQAIIDAARSQLGARYHWGGESPSTGFDCSGLVHYAYNQAGVNLSRKTAKGYVYGGRIISRSEAKPGDLVAYTGNDYGHMGIYVGNGKIIDASGSRQQVVERSMWNAPHVFVTYR